MLAASRFGLLRSQSPRGVSECVARSKLLSQAAPARQFASVVLTPARSAASTRRSVRQSTIVATQANQQRGHQAPMATSAPDPAVVRLREHQSGAVRQTFPDECKTLVHLGRYGVISTISKEYEGHPTGSIVGFASDDKVRARRAPNILQVLHAF